MTEPIRSVESAYLLEGVALLRDLLEPHGFTFRLEASATSSGGPFAAGRFVRGELEIGLIVRNASTLGCPNYSVGKGYAGHTDLIAALGAAGEEDLVQGEWLAFASRTGKPPFESLEADLRQFIVPALEGAPLRFRDALDAAVKVHHARLGL